MKKGKDDFNNLGLKEREKKVAAVKKAFCPNKGNLAEKLLIPANRVPKNKKESKSKSKRRFKSRLGPRFSSCLESIKETIKNFKFQPNERREDEANRKYENRQDG